MDEEKMPKAILFGILWFALAPLVVLLGPAIMIGAGTMDETIDYMRGRIDTSGFWPAFGRVYAACYGAGLAISLLYVAALASAGLRWRAPLGGGNAAGSIVLMTLAGANVVASAFTSAEGTEAFGVYLSAFFLALPGSIIAALALASWGRRLMATEEHFAARDAKRANAESGYMDESS